MIKTFIFVEDGSVDLDELKNSVGDDVLVVPYRQGAASPEIRQPREPVSRREVNIKDRLLDLMIEFDEMGFAPTTVCEDVEGFAAKWKEQVVNEIGRLETQITALWHKAVETKTDAIMQKNRADMLKEKNTNLQEGLKKAVEDVAERIKMAFYYEFDELIPSTMADKIDEIVKEVLKISY
jgi:hypothetical protein|nr:MAG TPA: hypothetical protein [Caudoviricetes sp.]